MKTQFRRLHLDRLIKLAQHLASGKLAHEKFNIGVYNENEIRNSNYGEKNFRIEKSTDNHYNNGVANMGNAIGECPEIFPEWSFVRMESESLGVSYIPMLKSLPAKMRDPEMKSAIHFFQITEDEFHLLFTPFQQESKKFQGWFQLKANSQADEQAYNLWRFIAEKAETMSVKVKIPQL